MTTIAAIVLPVAILVGLVVLAALGIVAWWIALVVVDGVIALMILLAIAVIFCLSMVMDEADRIDGEWMRDAYGDHPSVPHGAPQDSSITKDDGSSAKVGLVS